MIRVLYRHRSGALVDDLPIAQVPNALKDPQARVWVDMESAGDEDQKMVLTKLFQFHHLAVEDAINEIHVPKVDDYGGYLYLVFHSLSLGDEPMDIHTREIDVFVGPNYLVTVHETPSVTINKMWHKEYHQDRGLARGIALLLYEMLDRQVDGYMALLDQFETRIEELGDIIFQSNSSDERAILNEILTAKSSTLRIRRILLPQREVFEHLAHDDLSTIPTEARIYFQDLYDHMLRFVDIAESMRELVQGTMTTHLTLASNRLNEIMKVLTIISTIFMPLSFVAGIYGMNFDFMPELSRPWAYPLVWLIFLAIAAVMVLYFRRRNWL
ncbi:MAG: magnesium/cobalt transporter CorA [Caldilineaceae bacterium]|nr:magnesium/cobalt transporter CorA [Caldilineaceae bacterium]